MSRTKIKCDRCIGWVGDPCPDNCDALPHKELKDKILLLLNEPNTTDNYVVMGLIEFLDLEMTQHAGWQRRYNSSEEIIIE